MRLREGGNAREAGLGRRIAPALVGIDGFGARVARNLGRRWIGIELLVAANRQHDHASVLAQRVAHDALDVVWPDARVALDVLGQVSRVAGVVVIHIQQVRATVGTAHFLQALIERAFDLIARGLDFGLAWRLGCEAIQLGVDQWLQLRRGMT